MEISRLTRDGSAEPLSRDHILRREREQGNIHFFSCFADHEEQDWQPYPIDPYSLAICVTIHTYCIQAFFPLHFIFMSNLQ